MEKVYNKLVRDNIPKIIEEKGDKAFYRILTDEEYKAELEKKLYEEYQEVVEATGRDRLYELADMIEVIKALAKLEKATIDEVLTLADEKSEKRGAFLEKIFLEKVIEKD